MQTLSNIKQVFIDAIIDSVPDQNSVADKLGNTTYFNSKTVGEIFEELAIDSLGRIWFITIIEEKTTIKIEAPEIFFMDNSLKKIDEVIELIYNQNNSQSQ